MDVRTSDDYYYFVYDPILFGYSTQFWKDITGAGTVVANKIRLNADTIASKELYLRGDFTFRINVPAVPTGGDDRKVGLVSPAMGLSKNAAYFKWNGTAFTFEVVNASGTATSDPITWLAAWTATDTDFKISWNGSRVEASIGGVVMTTVSDVSLLPERQALSAYLLNANADNMDMAYFAVNAAQKFVENKEVNVTASLSASDIEIGAVEIKNGTDDTRMGVFAEDAAHTTGDTGILTFAVRNDAGTALAGTTGDYIPFTTDSTGALRVSGGSTQYTEDVASAGAESLTLAGAVRRDTAASSSGTDGDYSTLNTDASGRLYTNNTPSVYAVDDSAMPATPNMTPVGGEYRASPTTYADGDATVLQTDVNGNIKVVEQYAPGYEDNVAGVAKVEHRYSYAHIAAGQATTTVKSGAGFLHTITFNGAATATNVTTIYDNTAGSGTVIAIPAATTVTIPTTLIYDVSFATGLTFVTATANGADMTISYR